ncbi:TPA: hypothetical protein WH333_000634 [Neisseria meningitidis]
MNFSNEQKLFNLYAQLGQITFTEIRHLAFGRTSLHQNTPAFPKSVPTEALLQNLFVAGQLAEAMHNLPCNLHDGTYQQYLTLRNLWQFIEKNSNYTDCFFPTIAEIIQLNHQELAEIDADFVATIAGKKQSDSEYSSLVSWVFSFDKL